MDAGRARGRGRGQGRGRGSRGRGRAAPQMAQFAGEPQESGRQPRRRKRGGQLTVSDILSDRVTQLANTYWAPHPTVPRQPYKAEIVEEIYASELRDAAVGRVKLLELSQYLELFLWPNFKYGESSFAFIMSMIIMVNEKFREGVPPWTVFRTDDEKFKEFFQAYFDLVSHTFTRREKTYYIRFAVNCFMSLEDKLVRGVALSYVGLPLWKQLNHNFREKELKNLFREVPQLKKHWKQVEKNEKKSDKAAAQEKQSLWLPTLMREFVSVLNSIPLDGPPVDKQTVDYLERFVEVMTDLEAQLPTRRFFNTLVEGEHVLIHADLAPFGRRPEGKKFRQLVDKLLFYAGFEINDFTGAALSDDDVTDIHCQKVVELQQIAFKHLFGKLKDLSLSNIAAVQTRESLTEHFARLTDAEMRALCAHLGYRGFDDAPAETRTLLLEILIRPFEKRVSQLDQIMQMPLFPTEEDLYHEAVHESAEEFTGEGCLPLPKLNLQFLTLYDYLLRNFTLFRLESTYEIRQDLEEMLERVGPRMDSTGTTVFTGWARMALPVQKFSIVQVSKPDLGDSKPSKVKAKIMYTLEGLRGAIRDEWEGLHQHDVVFLLTIQAKLRPGESVDDDRPLHERFGLKVVRGAEVFRLLDADEKVIDEFNPLIERREPVGDIRTLEVLLDAAQFQRDLNEGNEGVYKTFNLFMRRDPKENNFKAVLETIRSLMGSKSSVPDWLHDIFLGYGDPAAAHYAKMPNQIRTIDFCDTFLDEQHVRDSFPGRQIEFTTTDKKLIHRPFKITFPELNAEGTVADGPLPPIVVEPYIAPYPGPYPQDQPKLNAVRYTPVQVEAIKAGINPGLTLVVGPPGTGKTDTAVQIINCLYHTFPEQRTLLITHSNQALNQLFEKIAELDIDPRHLLRLGHGTETLMTTQDFGKYGRVDYMLNERLQLLTEVERLARSLELSGDVAYTCETAAHFFLFQVQSRWEQFLARCAKAYPQLPGTPLAEFPFTKFFDTAPQPIFTGQSYQENMRIAEGCYRHITTMFQKLEDCRAFELLRNGKDRANYLLTRQAKIIAMTCTHAALKRWEMKQLRFRYDNLVMEEAGQILEIETFIPMLLQEDDIVEGCRLKRVMLIGDHNQLPPVVQNQAFQRYGHLDQSMFARFIRLQVPHIELDKQGRARHSIACLYNWRYKNLGDLPTVLQRNEYIHANAGLSYEYQLIDVGDFEGKGESQPSPYYYQNKGEAEYAVALFQLMRLLGYPAEKISIITTYNGQKDLIRDIVNYRCAKVPIFGRPAHVDTVDKFQGQQNDYIILSLVRTNNVGHLRDVRRLVVAMSRARLGLYVLCRRSLFENCYELTPTFSQLLQRPVQLQFVTGERWPCTRKAEDPGVPTVIADVIQLGQIVHAMALPAMQTLQNAQEYQLQMNRANEEAALRTLREQRDAAVRRQREESERMRRRAMGEEDEDDDEAVPKAAVAVSDTVAVATLAEDDHEALNGELPDGPEAMDAEGGDAPPGVEMMSFD